MLNLEKDYFINCPYCMESVSIRIDLTGGLKQSLVYDCEICCQSIFIRTEIDVNGITNLAIEKES